MIHKRLLAAACAVCFLLPAAASAQFPWYGPIAGGYGGYDNGGVYPFFYRVRSVPTPPYFALNPPVYYGPRLLYRPYGNSPYPYPSWYERQFDNVPSSYRVESSRPQLIVNPFVEQSEPATAQPTSASLPAEKRSQLNPHIADAR